LGVVVFSGVGSSGVVVLRGTGPVGVVVFSGTGSFAAVAILDLRRLAFLLALYLGGGDTTNAVDEADPGVATGGAWDVGVLGPSGGGVLRRIASA
jgi:hypothetical protein